MTFHRRGPEPGDLGYILKTTKRAMAKRLAPELGRDTWRLIHGALAPLLAHGTVKVAADPNDHRRILGFSIADVEATHYVYVRQECRGQGIARTLLTWSPEIATHLPHEGRLPLAYRYRPELFWRYLLPKGARNAL